MTARVAVKPHTRRQPNREKFCKTTIQLCRELEAERRREQELWEALEAFTVDAQLNLGWTEPNNG
jgi:hypothetical protein